MARFRFDLEPLLRAREIAEKEKQRDVATIEGERLAAEGRLRRIQQSILSDKNTMRSELVGSLDLTKLRSRAGVSLQSVREAQNVVLQLAAIHRRLDVARNELADAARERRAIEILKERRFEEWKSLQNRRETEALDELATIKASRRAVDEQDGASIAG